MDRTALITLSTLFKFNIEYTYKGKKFPNRDIFLKGLCCFYVKVLFAYNTHLMNCNRN